MATMVVSPAMKRFPMMPGATKPQPAVAREAAMGPFPQPGTAAEAAMVPARRATMVPRAELAADTVRTPKPVPVQAIAPVQAQAQRADQGGQAPAASPARVSAAADGAYLAALAARCVLGDVHAWELLIRREQRRVHGLCYRFTGSVTEAEDLTQEVFLKTYRNLRSFDPAKASFGVWLTALTRNLLVDHYRRSRLERASESLDEPMGGEEDGRTRADRLQDTRAGQEHHVAGLELRTKVQAALAKVSPELREAVILRDLEDLDYREIAEVLAIPQGTVKSRISRGRSELARLLKDMEGQVM